MIELVKKNPFGGLILNDLTDFEEVNSIKLPDDYRDFIINFNGGQPVRTELIKPKTDVNWLYCFVEEPDWASFFYTIDLFQGRIPLSYIPIGRDSAGNQFIMSVADHNKGVTALWLHEAEDPEDGTQYYDNVLWVANSFAEFVDNLS